MLGVHIRIFMCAVIYLPIINGMYRLPDAAEYLTLGTDFEITYPRYKKAYFDPHEISCIKEYKALVHDSCNRLKHQLLDACIKMSDFYAPNELNPLFIIALKIPLGSRQEYACGNQPEELAQDEPAVRSRKVLATIIKRTCNKLQPTTQIYRQFFAIEDDSFLEISFRVSIHKIIEEYSGKQMKKRTTPIQEILYEF